MAGWAGRPQEDHSGQRSRPPSTWGRGWQRRECPVPKGAPSGTFHIQARRSQPGTRPARAWTVTLSEAQPLLWCRDSAVAATRVTSTAHREDVASVKHARCHRPRQQRSCSATAGSQTLRPWSRRCSGTQAGSTRSHWVTSFLLGRVHSTTESLLLFQGTDPTSASTPTSPWPQLAHWQDPLPASTRHVSWHRMLQLAELRFCVPNTAPALQASSSSLEDRPGPPAFHRAWPSMPAAPQRPSPVDGRLAQVRLPSAGGRAASGTGLPAGTSGQPRARTRHCRTDRSCLPPPACPPTRGTSVHSCRPATRPALSKSSLLSSTVSPGAARSRG